MKKYKRMMLFLFLSFSLSSCTKLSQPPASTSEQTVIQAGQPLKINSNKRFLKQREVNRRLIHRIHRLHRV